MKDKGNVNFYFKNLTLPLIVSIFYRTLLNKKLILHVGGIYYLHGRAKDWLDQANCFGTKLTFHVNGTTDSYLIGVGSANSAIPKSESSNF